MNKNEISLDVFIVQIGENSQTLSVHNMKKRFQRYEGNSVVDKSF